MIAQPHKYSFYQYCRYYWRYYWFFICFNIYKMLYNLGLIKQTPVTPPTDIELFIEKHSKRFLKSYTDVSSIETMNANIEPIFYSRKEFKELLKDESNFLEKQWKSRILFENTPRGNIIMYYDTFKEGFAYYSDQNMTYNILNAVAMKYVLTFLCRDFFIDDFVTPQDCPSPFIKFIQEEEKEDNNKKMGVIKNMVKKSDNIPFAKLKNYSLQNEKPNAIKSSNKIKIIKTEDKRIYFNNKMLYLGKIFNFYVIQRIPKKKGIPLPTKFDTIFSGESEAQKSVMNYKMFKELHSASVRSLE